MKKPRTNFRGLPLGKHYIIYKVIMALGMEHIGLVVSSNRWDKNDTSKEV